MADKLMRTFVVMSFFLILALFSGCGTNGTSPTGEDRGTQITLQAGDNLTLIYEASPTTGHSW
jgi:hypothetical protein